VAHKFNIGQTVELAPRGFFVHQPRVHMKFVILFLPRTEIRTTPATALRVSLKNMNGSRVKAISRFRSTFSPEAIAFPPKADMCVQLGMSAGS
jgi:hypothetical protein